MGTDQRTIHLAKDDCFIVIKPGIQVQTNVPIGFTNSEIPDHTKYTIALMHLMYERNAVLEDLVFHKWNHLVEVFNEMRIKQAKVG